VGGPSGCRARTGWAKARSGAQTRRSASWSHRSRDGGTESSSDGENWGPSAGRELAGIIKKPAGSRRGSDVAIVSEEAGGQQNRRRSQGPLGGRVASEPVSAAERKFDHGIQRAQGRERQGRRINGASREGRRLSARLKPYWGKPAVRNFRGGGGKAEQGLMAVCHDARKGGNTGSHWPKHRPPPLYSTHPVQATWPGIQRPIRPAHDA
jgi:hypothetical protein